MWPILRTSDVDPYHVEIPDPGGKKSAKIMGNLWDYMTNLYEILKADPDSTITEIVSFWSAAYSLESCSIVTHKCS